MNTSFPVDFDSPKNTYYEILYVSRQPSLSSFGAKPLSSPPVSALQILTQISSQRLNANIAHNYYRSPLLLSYIVTDVATNRIYTGFSPHLHCRTQKRPCQSGRNAEPTKSFSYTYLLRVLPQISFSSQAKGFAKNEDKSFAPGISPLFKLLGGEIYLAVSWYTFVCFILHIHRILHFCIPRPKFLEPKWSQISIAIIIAFNLL